MTVWPSGAVCGSAAVEAQAVRVAATRMTFNAGSGHHLSHPPTRPEAAVYPGYCGNRTKCSQARPFRVLQGTRANRRSQTRSSLTLSSVTCPPVTAMEGDGARGVGTAKTSFATGAHPKRRVGPALQHQVRSAPSATTEFRFCLVADIPAGVRRDITRPPAVKRPRWVRRRARRRRHRGAGAVTGRDRDRPRATACAYCVGFASPALHSTATETC